MRITYNQWAGTGDLEFPDNIIDLRSKDYEDIDVEWAKSLARLRDRYDHLPTRVVGINGKTVFWVRDGVEFEKLNGEWILVRGFIGSCPVKLERDKLSDGYVYGYLYTVDNE